MRGDEIKVGDLVKKKVGACAGEVGIVLSIETSQVDNTFIVVMPLDGTERLWYADLVQVINERG